jgi:hypothetical protein
MGKHQETTSKLQQMATLMGASEETIEQKIKDAISEVGLFHPRMELVAMCAQEPQQAELVLAKLFRVPGMVTTVLKAKKALETIHMLNVNSMSRALADMRRSKEYWTVELWKVSGPEGKKIKSSFEFLAKQSLTFSSIQKAAQILGYSLIEPTEGRTWPAMAANKRRREARANAENESREGNVVPSVLSSIHLASLAITTGVKSAPATVAEVPAPVAEVAAPEVMAPPVKSPPVELNSKVLETPRKSPPLKQDLTDILDMLRSALNDARITKMIYEPGEGNEQPKVMFEQRITRTVTSIDDLE